VARELEVDVIATERLVPVCAPDHPEAGCLLTGADLRHQRWLVFPERPDHPESTGTILRRMLERHQVPADRLRPIDSLSAQRALILAGYGLALLPPGVVADDLASGRLAPVEIPALDIEAAITLVTRRHGHHLPATRAVIDLLRDGDGDGDSDGYDPGS
jgi:DNA-binding transcriptional LysR family regulator